MTVFISHSGRELDPAVRIYSFLSKERRISCFLAERHVESDLLDSLTLGLQKCTVVLCLVSKNFDASGWCKNELAYGSLLKKTFTAIQLEQNHIPMLPGALLLASVLFLPGYSNEELEKSLPILGQNIEKLLAKKWQHCVEMQLAQPSQGPSLSCTALQELHKLREAMPNTREVGTQSSEEAEQQGPMFQSFEQTRISDSTVRSRRSPNSKSDSASKGSFKRQKRRKRTRITRGQKKKRRRAVQKRGTERFRGRRYRKKKAKKPDKSRSRRRSRKSPRSESSSRSSSRSEAKRV